MFMPTVFHENLFDDLFDPFWNEGALERAMNREARDTFGKRGANMMKTDVKQTDNGYEVDVDLPGCKKEDVQMDLSDGYLTIQAVRSHSNDEKDNKGRYVRRETFSGSCARSFYVGEVKKEDIHASDRDRVNADRVRQGITYIGCPRRAATSPPGAFFVFRLSTTERGELNPLRHRCAMPPPPMGGGFCSAYR